MPPASPRPLGVHTSIAGGLHLALARGAELGCTTIQMFARNPRAWNAAPLSKEESGLFRRTRDALGISPVFVHAPYILNIASPDESLRKRSALALREELLRAALLGCDYVVLHTGTAHDGRGIERAILSIREAMEGEAMESGERPAAGLLVENTSGKSGDTTPRIEGLARIVDGARGLVAGICLDTCHAHAAGYDLATQDGREDLVREVSGLVGPERLRLIHLNDSRAASGSGTDRHEHLGLGTIGLDALRAFLAMPLIAPVPVILETPKQTENDDPRNLRTARMLISDPPWPG